MHRVVLGAPVVEETRGALGGVHPRERQWEEDVDGHPGTVAVDVAHSNLAPRAKEDCENLPHTLELGLVWHALALEPQPVTLFVGVHLDVRDECSERFPVAVEDQGHNLGRRAQGGERRRVVWQR